MAPVFADPWFPFVLGDFTQRTATFHAPYFDNLFSQLGARAIFCFDHKVWRLLTFWGERYCAVPAGSRYLAYEKMYFEIFSGCGILRKGIEAELLKVEKLCRREVIRLKSFDEMSHVNLTICGYVIDRYLWVLLYSSDESKPASKSIAAYETIKKTILDAIGFIERGVEFFENVPKSIFELRAGNEKRLFERYFGPHSFCPIKEPEVPFMWPWQRCLCRAPDGSVKKRPIRTTSIVLDLRNSTTAMNLSLDEERFSELISTVISFARQKIVEGGGFFDRETGDGVVGHFCDEVSSSLGESDAQNATIRQALSVAINIVAGMRKEFYDYRDNLRHGIEFFGPAIGLHNGDAVWLYSRQGIRAIGRSVIEATRLCSNARANEICVSNTFLTSFVHAHNGTMLDLFTKRSVGIAEIRGEAGAYGYILDSKDLEQALRLITLD